MNPKITRYALITAALVVWGSIVYKVVAGLNHDESKAVVPLVKALQTQIKTDSFTLLSNYPDPFLADGQLYESDVSLLDTLSSEPGELIMNPVTSESQLPVDVSFIKYTGLIFNPIKKLKVAFINLRGRDYMVKEKDSVEEISIKKISVEKICIVYQKRNFEIIKSNQ